MGVSYACSVTYACGCSSVEQRKPVAVVQSQNVSVAPMQLTGVEGKAGESASHAQHVNEDPTYKGLLDAPLLDMLPKTCLLAKKEAPAPLRLLPDALPRPPELPRSPQSPPPVLDEPLTQERPGPPRPPNAQVVPRARSDVTDPSPRARLRSLERELLNPLLSAEEGAALRAEVVALRGHLASAPGQAGVLASTARVEEQGTWLDSLAGSCAAMSVSKPAFRSPLGDMCAIPNNACTQPDLQEPDKVILQEDASWLRCRREQLASEYRLLPNVCRSEVETAVGASLTGPHLRPRTLIPERTW